MGRPKLMRIAALNEDLDEETPKQMRKDACPEVTAGHGRNVSNESGVLDDHDLCTIHHIHKTAVVRLKKVKLSTGKQKQKIHTDKQKIHTDKQKIRTDKQKIHTDKQKILTDKQKIHTDKQKRHTGQQQQ